MKIGRKSLKTSGGAAVVAQKFSLEIVGRYDSEGVSFTETESTRTMRIIINADDFGLNVCVNDRILDLMSRHRITSATFISNAPSVEDAVRKIPREAYCSFGVHLNLTQFEPLTPPKDRGILSACLDEKGYFLGEKYLRSTRITSTLRKAFFKELSLQVERMCALGVKISHFDSHNHVHTIPALFPVLKQLQEHFGIRKVRTTWNMFSSPAPSARPAASAAARAA